MLSSVCRSGGFFTATQSLNNRTEGSTQPPPTTATLNQSVHSSLCASTLNSHTRYIHTSCYHFYPYIKMSAAAAKFAARQVPVHLVGSLVHVSIPIQVDPSSFTKRNLPEDFAYFESEEPEIASRATIRRLNKLLRATETTL